MVCKTQYQVVMLWSTGEFMEWLKYEKDNECVDEDNHEKVLETEDSYEHWQELQECDR
jgi:hypothetical protein